MAAATRPWNGGTLAVARVGTPAAFSVTVTDPGSDDITTSWAYGDGNRAQTRSLLHPPVVDPASSPTMDPRAFVATVRHTYDRACTRRLAARATDDDGGASPTRARTVVVLGTSTTRRPLAWWSAEYRGLTSALTAAERSCLLSTARTLSTVFPEKRALTTSTDAVRVLRPAAPATPRATFDARLLVVWLDVATGAVDPFAPFDADGNGSPETTIGAWLLAAERTRNASSATSGALAPLTSVLTRISGTS